MKYLVEHGAGLQICKKNVAGEIKDKAIRQYSCSSGMNRFNGGFFGLSKGRPSEQTARDLMSRSIPNVVSHLTSPEAFPASPCRPAPRRSICPMGSC